MWKWYWMSHRAMKACLLQVASIALALVSMSVSCYTTVQNHVAFFTGCTEPGDRPSWSGYNWNRDDAKLANILYFHITFSTAVCFVMMSLTDWTFQNDLGIFHLDGGTVSTWVMIATSWMCHCIYLLVYCSPHLSSSHWMNIAVVPTRSGELG